MMGYADGVIIADPGNRPANVSFWLDDLVCEGNEDDIGGDCRHRRWGETFCKQNETAAIRCTGNSSITFPTGGERTDDVLPVPVFFFYFY